MECQHKAVSRVKVAIVQDAEPIFVFLMELGTIFVFAYMLKSARSLKRRGAESLWKEQSSTQRISRVSCV
jgi:hypothetical protein